MEAYAPSNYKGLWLDNGIIDRACFFFIFFGIFQTLFNEYVVVL